jgi:organic radical activating enzyme
VKTYKINELFYSLQGEGSRAGTANVFVRFSGCDLACGFCDTEFESGKEMTAQEIVSEALRLMPHRGPAHCSVILTGGEPALQYDEELSRAFRSMDIFVAVETNGNSPLKAPADWVSCSPKVADHVVARNFPKGVDEIRYVRHSGQSIPEAKGIPVRYRFVSPQFDGDRLDRASLAHCMALVLENPMWGLSVQQHKLWRVR